MIHEIAAGIIYLLYTRGEARLEGNDWEKIFADGIKAEWKPSNVGLDDVRLGSCCWGAKTVKVSKPAQAKHVRLISGRNALGYSFAETDARSLDPATAGNFVLDIWNARASAVRVRFAHCRTVVLIKSDDLSECSMFEFETVRFESDRYTWGWNKNNNLEGYDEAGQHRFTWQPHGSQFTVIEDVPENRVAFKLRLPGTMPRDKALRALGFDSSWVEII